MAKNIIATSLPQYVDENKIGLVAKSVLGGRTASLISLNTGIKDQAAITVLDSDVTLQDGSDCGWTPAGTSTLTQRKIATGQFKVNQSFCDKSLLHTYANHQIKIAAGAKEMPFEEELTNQIVADVQAKIEKLVWQGNKESDDLIDGFVTILDKEVSAKAVELAPGTNKYEAIKAMNLAIPSEIRGKGDVVIFVGEDFFAGYISELVDKNLYHYDAENDGVSYKLPGFNVTVEAVAGLNGTNRLYAGRKSNFYYGCDMAGDEEKFEFSWANEAKEFRLDIEFNAGVNVALPSEIRKATLS